MVQMPCMGLGMTPGPARQINGKRTPLPFDRCLLGNPLTQNLASSCLNREACPSGLITAIKKPFPNRSCSEPTISPFQIDSNRLG